MAICLITWISYNYTMRRVIVQKIEALWLLCTLRNISKATAFFVRLFNRNQHIHIPLYKYV